jgi:hypothetical protein
MLGLKKERPVRAKLGLDLQILLSQQSVIYRYSDNYGIHNTSITTRRPRPDAMLPLYCILIL